jgi:sigma-B regulation protein RsbU (phosphoserine phosphatase)
VAQEETAYLLDVQSSLFRRLQETLVDIPREFSGVEFGHLYRSATQQARVGGDFYDVFEAKEGRIALLIGDVCGHGLEAARIAILVKDIVYAFAHQFRRPQLVLREANRLLVEKNLPGFVTVFLGLLDHESGTLIYSSAGHPPPLLSQDGQVERLKSVSSPMGVFADARYRDTETGIREGSLLLLYTDGITEARQDGDFFGERRLADALRRRRDRPIEEVPSLLLDEALDFSLGTLQDDVALLAVSYLGGRAGTGT